jgi:RNA polymerase sigma factor for flagellar operon FliA
MKLAVKAYEAGLEAEVEERVLGYLPLVHHIVARLTTSLPAHLDRDDLLSAGVCGLLQAAKSFDPTKGASFKTHAYTRVRGEILDELRRADSLPRQKRKQLREVQSTHFQLTSELGRTPSLEELADATGRTESEIDGLLGLAHRFSVLSLDAGGVTQAEGATLLDLVSSPAALDPSALAARRERKETLIVALRALPEREREVIGLYYHKSLLLREIGELLGVSESRVCQIHARALYLLRKALTGAK